MKRMVQIGMKAIAAALAVLFLLTASGCDNQQGGSVRLDPNRPTTIDIWNYYNGATKNAFDELVNEFNETVGKTTGIIVETSSLGNISELETAVMASANKEVGSKDMPQIFASYADTAYAAEQLGILANLDSYFTADEQKAYLSSYIEEGKIGKNGELRIFPIAKATEVFMINDTDWQPFATANGLDYADLATIEDIARIAKLYYEWTDEQTPDIENDGRAFFGRDAMANLMIIGSKQLGKEIFAVTDGKAEIQVDEQIMRRIWDSYYVPYISGYFLASGRYRSDDMKVGDVLSYVGSTASAAYFPSEVTKDGQTYPISPKILPVPVFEGAKKVMVQQGAGMVIVKSTPEKEYASSVFLKWISDIEPNIRFSAMSGYMPVKMEANALDKILSVAEKNGVTIDAITRETIVVSLEAMKDSELYTNKAFRGGAAARGILENSLQSKAAGDREAVINAIAGGQTHADAVAQFNTEQNFTDWVAEISAQLNEAAK